MTILIWLSHLAALDREDQGRHRLVVTVHHTKPPTVHFASFNMSTEQNTQNTSLSACPEVCELNLVLQIIRPHSILFALLLGPCLTRLGIHLIFLPTLLPVRQIGLFPAVFAISSSRRPPVSLLPTPPCPKADETKNNPIQVIVVL